jgi:hypothetical protein
MVHPGTDAADPTDNPWDFLGWPTNDKLLKPPECGNGDPGVADLSGFIEVDINTGMALNAGYRMY